MRRSLHAGVIGILVCAALVTAPLAGQRQTPPAAAKPPKDPNAIVWPDAQTLASQKKSAENRRLFRSADPLPFTLTANFSAVDGDRDPNSTKTYPAVITVAKDDGTMASIPLQIRGRGHARRQICSFSPLRLEFQKDQTKGTVFEGPGALKLGTHCANDFPDYLLREYAVYQIYNLLTPRSFRVRLANATYVDAKSQKIIATREAMFIEDDDDVAKRLEGRVVDVAQVTFNRVDMETVTLMTLFDYMIGNTDMSLFLQHNVRLVQTPAGHRYAIPYDFDYAGLVDAHYAVPGAGLGLVTVRDRLYRGPCHTAAEFEPYFVKMRAIKAGVMAIIDALPGVSAGYRKSAKGYLEQFYRTIDRPDDAKRAFIEDCKGRPYM